MTMNNAANRTLTIKKVLNAPVKLVWEAWTQPGHIAKWWGPQGMEVKILEHDFRAEGNWKYAMDMPNGGTFVSEGVFSEIVEFEKIITSADFKPMTEGVELQIILEADGDKTNFTFHCIHPTPEYCKQQEEMGFYNGWGSAFDRLEKLLVEG